MKVPELEKELMQRKDLFKKMYDEFLPFYSSSKSPTLDFETAEQIWTVYLKGVMPYHADLVEYLAQLKEKPPKVHKDLWRMMY